MGEDLDEYSEDRLQAELDRRAANRSMCLCDYCGRSPDTTPCRFPERHIATLTTLYPPGPSLAGWVFTVEPKKNESGLWECCGSSGNAIVNGWGHSAAQALVYCYANAMGEPVGLYEGEVVQMPMPDNPPQAVDEKEATPDESRRPATLAERRQYAYRLHAEEKLRQQEDTARQREREELGRRIKAQREADTEGIAGVVAAVKAADTQPDATPPEPEVTSNGPLIKFTEEHVNYVVNYGGECRDCADDAVGGVCSRTGLPCGGRAPVVRYVLEALAYGVRCGFVAAPVIKP